MHFLPRRLPDRQEILLALGGVIFVVYGWALRGFLYQFSSFILFHSVGDILAIFAYVMALALLESLTVLGVLLLASLLLPPAWFRAGFAYKALLAVLVAAAAAVGLDNYLTKKMSSELLLLGGLAVSIILWIGLASLIERGGRIRAVLMDLMDRMQIFTYIFVPIGVLSLLVVLFRNLK
jgi:hypothetical protein